MQNNGGSNAERTIGTTLTVRAIIVLILALALTMATAAMPAQATDGGDDLESVRNSVIDTFNYKINLLSGEMAETDNAARDAIFSAAIALLASLRDGSVATADIIDALWALKDQAHSIYHGAINDANNVEGTPEEELAEAKAAVHNKIENKIGRLANWIEGCTDPKAQAIVADGIAQLRALFAQLEAATNEDTVWGIKDKAYGIYGDTMAAAESTKKDDPDKNDKPKEEPKEEPKDEEPTEEEKAAAALATARRNTQSLITRRASVLRSASAAAQIPAVITIYAAAADAVDALSADAKNAKSLDALEGINAKVKELFEGAKAAAAEHDGTGDGDPTTDTVDAYLQRVIDYVTRTTAAAAPTEPESPETFAILVSAKEQVLANVAAVAEVSESGNRLSDRWDDLNESLASFRQALVRHYLSLENPTVVEGINIPG
ncbi:MAG: hypothetical protein ACR2N7_12300 [Acidimicrobiia bacterium]